MPRPATPHRPDGVHARTLRSTEEVARRFLRQRPWVIALAGGCLFTTLWWGAAPWQQLALVGGAMSVVLSAFFYERHRWRSRPISTHTFARSLLLTEVAITAMSCLTGGLQSPLTPMLFAPLVTGFATFGRRRETLLLLAVLGGAHLPLWLAWRWPLFPFLPEPAHTVLRALCSLTAMALLYLSVTQLRSSLEETVVALDTERQARHEQAMHHARDLAAVGAKVSHDIRNPLASIKGLVQLEARGIGAEESRRIKRFEMLSSELERVERLLEDHLSFARPTSALHLSELSTEALLDELGTLRELLSPRLHQDALTLEIAACPSPHDKSSHLDKEKLRQALMNLTLNAIEASLPGGVITLEVEACEAHLALRLQDRGEGMSPSELQRLGTPHYTTRPEGNGLGVVMARALIAQHGGALRHESAPGEGTRVTITLPYRGAEDVPFAP